MASKPYLTINGVEIFATRRRYSNRTFTWLDAKLGEELVSLGDPWPCVMPKRAEVETELRTTRAIWEASRKIDFP